MATYSVGNKQVEEIINDLIDENYPDLVESQAKIGAVFAYPTLGKDGEPTGDAVSQYGMKALGKIKVNSEADRIEGKPDATITIDHAQWEDMAGENKRAFLDRFLYSITVRRKEGEAIKDDQGRPKLKIAKPDWFFTGFVAMAKRHGAASIERIQAKILEDDFGQYLFGFMEPGEFDPEPASKPKRRSKAASVAAANR